MKSTNTNASEGQQRAGPKPNSAVIIRKIDETAEGDGSKVTNKTNIELLTDHQFSRAFEDSSKSSYKTNLYQSVQTCLKSKRGLGEPIIVKFYAPLKVKNPGDRIEYNYRTLGDDVELIQSDQFKYCLKQCYKMAYYISKLYQIEILRMQCEFLKDDNKTIWFTYAD